MAEKAISTEQAGSTRTSAEAFARQLRDGTATCARCGKGLRFGTKRMKVQGVMTAFHDTCAIEFGLALHQARFGTAATRRRV